VFPNATSTTKFLIFPFSTFSFKMSSTTGPYNARRSSRSTPDGDANPVMSASNQLTSELELTGSGIMSFSVGSTVDPTENDIIKLRPGGVDLWVEKHGLYCLAHIVTGETTCFCIVDSFFE
jgi:hypothetical protein